MKYSLRFNYNGSTIPVQFELKKNNNPNDNNIYVVATIKKDAITALKPTNVAPRTPASSSISIEDLIGLVNGLRFCKSKIRPYQNCSLFTVHCSFLIIHYKLCIVHCAL